MINGFSVFSNNYLRHINNFLNQSDPLPNKPSLPFDDNYVNELKAFEGETLAYFISICNCLYYYLRLEDSYFNGKIKDAYYKIRIDYKEFRSYLKTAKQDFNNSKQIGNCARNDGSMSPSNPFYSIDDENGICVEPIDGYYFMEEVNDNSYVFKYLKKLRKLVSAIKKRKKKKLTKNQRKKLKKKTKITHQTSQEQISNLFGENYATFDSGMLSDPQLMIKEFFRQYSETGEWSWSTWNHYITQTQQTNPAWFNLFSRYCYEMGIDWNTMFASGLNARNAENNILDDGFVTTPYQQCNYTEYVPHPDEGKSVIFTTDVKPPIDDKNSNELFCDACKYEFKSKKAFHIHLRGVKHIQNELNCVKDQKPERFITEIDRENSAVLMDITKEEKHLKWRLYNEENSKVPGNYTCTICDVTCTSHKDLHTHLGGEKHHLNTTSDCVDVSPLLPVNVSTKNSPVVKQPIRKVVSRIQLILNTCTQPTIGLNFITEYQRYDELLESKYVCELCKVKFDRKTFIKHVVSPKHRETYLKYVHPELYDILRQDLSSKSVKSKRLEVFSEEVETFEGRKKVNIMMERIVCAEDQINNTKELNDVHIERLDVEESKQQITDIDEVSEIDDKEDGEVESSDDEIVPKNMTVKVPHEAQSEIEESFAREELEAGEIENNLSDKEITNGDEKEAGEWEDDIEQERTPELDLSEFVNYEIVYQSDRPSLDIVNRATQPRSFEFITQLKERKKLKLREVTSDIVDHFRQEAIWALNNTPINNRQYSKNTAGTCNGGKDKRDLPGGLLLPSVNVPVGPVFTGTTSYHYKSKKHIANKSCMEKEFANIIERIESITGIELNKDKNTVNDTHVLQKLQNILVNKEYRNNSLNEAIMKELLWLEDRECVDNSNGGRKDCKSTSTLRRHLLPDPTINDSAVCREEQLSNCASVDTSKEVHNGDSSDNLARLGDKLKQRAHFLGLDQPPPPNIFHKVPPAPDHNVDMSSDFHHNVYNHNMPIMYPYISPGMIEHHNSFSLWTPYNHNNLYNKRFLRPNITQSSFLSESTSKSSGSNI